MRKFWGAYTKQLNFDCDAEEEPLEQCMRYGAARMIQTAYEYMFDEPELNEATHTLVKFGRWILDEPQAAISLFMST